MMKRSLCLLVFFFFVVSGCTYETNEFQAFIENSKTLLQDPHFARYKEKRADLERQYLQKRLTYADYIAQRDKLDLLYAKEVQERTKIIEGQK